MCNHYSTVTLIAGFSTIGYNISMLKQLEQDRATQLVTRTTLGSLPDYYTQAYNLAVQSRPLLSQTEVVLGTPDTYPILSYTSGFLEDVRKTQPGLRIVLNDPAKLDFTQLKFDRYWLLRHIAEKLAVPVDTLRSHPISSICILFYMS